MGRDDRSHLPANVRKRFIGYTVIGQIRRHDGKWIVLEPWGLTLKGARRRLDRWIAEEMW